MVLLRICLNSDIRCLLLCFIIEVYIKELKIMYFKCSNCHMSELNEVFVHKIKLKETTMDLFLVKL